MIICLGTTPALQRTMVFDRLQLDTTNRAVEVSEYASGKPINVARVLNTLQQPAIVTGFLGGYSGRTIQQDLEAAGIAHDFVPVAPPTRLCITVVDRAAGTATELIQESAAIQPADCDSLHAKLRELLTTAKVLVLSGSLAPGVLIHFYADCVRAARAAGVATIVDAKGESLRLAIEEGPTVVKPNRIELEETAGAHTSTDAELCELVAGLLGKRPTAAVVTLGAAGAIAFDGSDFWRITVPPIKAVSAIGSGDSFAAGLAAGLSNGLEIPAAACLASACAVANALTDKAGHLQMEDVQRLMGEIMVEEIDF